MEQFVFLTTADDLRGKIRRIQQEPQTVCPFTETGLLPGKRGRPRRFSICRYASSDEIERREDKISRIRSSLISGRMTGFVGPCVFTAHEDRAERVWRQVGLQSSPEGFNKVPEDVGVGHHAGEALGLRAEGGDQRGVAGVGGAGPADAGVIAGDLA